jgi:rubrerythrin
MEKFGHMITFEQQAAEFYKSGAENSIDEGIKKIFTTLMNNDKVHLKLLNDLITKGDKFEIDEEDFDSSLFSCLDDCGCAKLRAEELATYVSASDMERKIISSYTELKQKVYDERVLEVIEYIIKKHKDALFVLNDMTEMLNRSSDWVESAEFTLREPY